MPLPNMYSPEPSLFVLKAGIKLLETEKPLIMYYVFVVDGLHTAQIRTW
jgi:hypothetical protein